jgi:hypothetical protein
MVASAKHRKATKTWETTRVQNLVRHKSGRHYARAFAGGKEKWKSLGTAHYPRTINRALKEPAYCCLLDCDFHSFAGKHRARESFLTQFFDALKKVVVVFGVVVREGQLLHAGHFRKLHGLIEAAVSPSASFS